MSTRLGGFCAYPGCGARIIIDAKRESPGVPRGVAGERRGRVVVGQLVAFQQLADVVFTALERHLTWKVGGVKERAAPADF